MNEVKVYNKETQELLATVFIDEDGSIKAVLSNELECAVDGEILK